MYLKKNLIYVFNLRLDDKELVRSSIEELVDVNRINNNNENRQNHHPIGILNNSSKMSSNNEIRHRKTVTFKD